MLIWEQSSLLRARKSALIRNWTLLEPWSWTFRPQNCEKITYCCLSLSACGISEQTKTTHSITTTDFTEAVLWRNSIPKKELRWISLIFPLVKLKTSPGLKMRWKPTVPSKMLDINRSIPPLSCWHQDYILMTLYVSATQRGAPLSIWTPFRNAQWLLY